MKSLLPLFPFVAALGLLACQGNDGPVSEDAAAPPDDVVIGSATSDLAVPASSAAAPAPASAAPASAADAAVQAVLPIADHDMGWTGTPSDAHFGPSGARPLLMFACTRTGLIVKRLHPATPGATGTLSFTGGGTASSMPVRAIAVAGGPGESEWRGEARGDVARAVARAFAGKGQVEVTLGGAPALAVPTSPLVDAVFQRCAA